MKDNPNTDYALVELLPPEAQLEWFNEHPGLRLKWQEWAKFYCQSLQHRGLCCESCFQDYEYEGGPNYDDHCCCEGYRAAQIDSSERA